MRMQSPVPVAYAKTPVAPRVLARPRRWFTNDTMVIDVLAVCEFVMIVCAALLSKLLYITLAIQDGSRENEYFVAGLIGGAIAIVALRSHKLYDRKAIVEWDDYIAGVLGTLTLSFLLLLAVAYLMKVSSDYSRAWFLIWYGISFIGIVLLRSSAAATLKWLAATGRTTRRIAVVVDGDKTMAAQFEKALRREPGVDVMGVFQAGEIPNGPASQVASGFVALIKAQLIDEVIVMPSASEPRRLEKLVARLSAFPIDVWVHPNDLTVPIIGTERVGQVSLLHVQPKPIRNWGYVSKVVFDYAVGVTLLTLAAPFLAIIALAIRFESPGPAFFRQKRHGLNYRVIDVYKFRTMRVMENGPTVKQAEADDPRVTRVGRILRKTSLDELPQLINVLRGEMSLIGPRPHAVAHNEFYGEQVERYANRHRVKPGITGLAQISGFRGPTDDPEKMRQRVRKDLEYIANWSMWMDFKILVLTMVRGFVHRNAM